MPVVNTITAIAFEKGRDYVTPEDVQEAMRAHREDPHRVRIDVLEILAGETDYPACLPNECARAAYDGPEPFVGPLQVICRNGGTEYGTPCQGHIPRGCKSSRDCNHNYFF
jgi:hypothetical protein